MFQLAGTNFLLRWIEKKSFTMHNIYDNFFRLIVIDSDEYAWINLYHFLAPAWKTTSGRSIFCVKSSLSNLQKSFLNHFCEIDHSFSSNLKRNFFNSHSIKT